jgi:hypothetical protein
MPAEAGLRVLDMVEQIAMSRIEALDLDRLFDEPVHQQGDEHADQIYRSHSRLARGRWHDVYDADAGVSLHRSFYAE